MRTATAARLAKHHRLGDQHQGCCQGPVLLLVCKAHEMTRNASTSTIRSQMLDPTPRHPTHSQRPTSLNQSNAVAQSVYTVSYSFTLLKVGTYLLSFIYSYSFLLS